MGATMMLAAGPQHANPMGNAARQNPLRYCRCGNGDGVCKQRGHVLPDLIDTNLPKTACYIHTAYFVIQGQDDVITRTQAAVEYFKCVKAPKKELILIPNAGHFAFMTASDKFLEVLTSKVRPVAIARGA